LTEQVKIHGFCDDTFLPLKEVFIQNFEDGLEIGASLAVYHQGKPMVDIWAGYADRKKERPWKEDTIVCVFSSTKVPTIICTLMAIDRGLLDLDNPIVAYWPEFGAHGKEKLTVRDAMTHHTLVPSFSPPQPYSVAHDWEKMVELIANQKPWFEPGTICYHPIVYGHILGELVRRVTGVGFQAFFDKELAEPLHADFHIGLKNPKDSERTAILRYNIIDGPPDEESIPFKVMRGIYATDPTIDEWRTWERQSAVIPASTGHGNARSMVKLANLLALNGTVDGRSYLSKEMINEARSEQCHEICPLMGEIKLGLGFGLDSSRFPATSGTSFHWGGYGGSWCLMDPITQTAATYAMNNCFVSRESEDVRRVRFWEAYQEIQL
jgi:CubicO group peptidase (beta-lactamase class C family)